MECARAFNESELLCKKSPFDQSRDSFQGKAGGIGLLRGNFNFGCRFVVTLIVV
jgi:hypothetical protein